jgi:hypothetical protein
LRREFVAPPHVLIARSGGRSCSRRKIRRAGVAALLAFSVVGFARPAFPNEICGQFETFVGGKLPGGSTRWVEVRWFGTLGIQEFGVECHHSEDASSTAFCNWLVPHTSFEWPDSLPQNILSCRGYRFPKFAHWEDWKGAVQLHRQTGNAALLQIELAGGGHRAVRLTVFSEENPVSPSELPPLFPDTSAAAPRRG